MSENTEIKPIAETLIKNLAGHYGDKEVPMYMWKLLRTAAGNSKWYSNGLSGQDLVETITFADGSTLRWEKGEPHALVPFNDEYLTIRRSHFAV